MSITRRVFLRNGALAIVGTAALPSFLTRAAYGAESLGSRHQRLVAIFQRGAADGLNVVLTHGEPAYSSIRASHPTPRNTLVDLVGLLSLSPDAPYLYSCCNARIV